MHIWQWPVLAVNMQSYHLRYSLPSSLVITAGLGR